MFRHTIPEYQKIATGKIWYLLLHRLYTVANSALKLRGTFISLFYLTCLHRGENEYNAWYVPLIYATDLTPTPTKQYCSHRAD
ncbi:MAG: hypothetical protein RLZZ360_128 [Candidatus Parcubacteria bacterium]|jgi:hypothetical protein